jgi:hypothetical protein
MISSPFGMGKTISIFINCIFSFQIHISMH